MIHTTYEFVQKFLGTHPISKNTRVLDVGSRDINGTIKPLFPCRYVGLDFLPGQNVDVVLDAHDIKKHFVKESFDIVVTLDTLEHDLRFWETIDNMRWVLKPGGWLIIAVPSINHPLHKHPNDYYRFFDSVFSEIFFAGYEDVHIETQWYFDNDERNPDEVCGWGRKPRK